MSAAVPLSESLALVNASVAGRTRFEVAGLYRSPRVKKKLEKKHKKDQKELYQQYYNDVYALQKEKADLLATLEQYTKKR